MKKERLYSGGATYQAANDEDEEEETEVSGWCSSVNERYQCYGEQEGREERKKSWVGRGGGFPIFTLLLCESGRRRWFPSVQAYFHLRMTKVTSQPYSSSLCATFDLVHSTKRIFLYRRIGADAVIVSMREYLRKIRDRTNTIPNPRHFWGDQCVHVDKLPPNA
ncbi:hypothetical protein K450DRAFT_235384 [Umbelopsis ramanniana AG]|uniref:Uncharacterized protein n=1 Tax=Umbelopsis ramanniana AG TaxID=1314678 RepID=A0AAD5EBL9_UMBRA|nr:uncharacterized protein K450DRAFT_235384 [Umbelopsis ramanniana AG]KAI8580948.1 hypothetical protein K450DRAFT_235384 [Umbelopsis ramanniana AG]